jgi:hypothetical protein
LVTTGDQSSDDFSAAFIVAFYAKNILSDEELSERVANRMAGGMSSRTSELCTWMLMQLADVRQKPIEAAKRPRTAKKKP